MLFQSPRFAALITALVITCGGSTALASYEANFSDSSNKTPHPPILIEGNGGFTKANGVTGGSGTPSDPFLIDGWKIFGANQPPIKVMNTDKHVKIQGNVFTVLTPSFVEGLFPVYLENVANLSLVQNDIDGFSWGIFVDRGSDIVVDKNTISSPAGQASNGLVHMNLGALTVLGLEHSVLSNNSIESFARGISIQKNSTNLTVHRNHIENTSWTAAIEAFESSNHLKINHNVILNKPGANGIGVYNNIRNVTIGYNSIDGGIQAFDIAAKQDAWPESVVVHNNEVNSVESAIFQCTLCNINNNTFSSIENGLEFVSQDIAITHNEFKDSELAIFSLWPEADFHNNTFDPSNSYHAATHQRTLNLSYNWWGRPEPPPESKFIISHSEGKIVYEPILLMPPGTDSTVSGDPDRILDNESNNSPTVGGIFQIFPVALLGGVIGFLSRKKQEPS